MRIPGKRIKNFLQTGRFRAITMRFDKTARGFLASVYMASTVIWLNSRHVLDQKAGYVLVQKKNQKSLHKATDTYFSTARAAEFKPVQVLLT